MLQVLVINELIAVVAEQIGSRVGHTHANYMFAQFLEFGHQRRKIAVAGKDDEGVYMFLGVSQVHRVHAQADIRRVLATLAAPRNVNQLEARLVQCGGVGGVIAPVGVSLTHDDFPLFDHPPQHAVDVEPLMRIGQP
ncbi:hypothetical protein HRbin36_02051 [bacterium HR36]|nr:hypothetical protein HRbin36_02051 [bacterium HR36]